MSTAKAGGTARASRSASGSSSARGGGGGAAATGGASVEAASTPATAAATTTTTNSKKGNAGGANAGSGGGNKQQQQGGKRRGSSPKRQRQSSSPQQQLAQLPGGAPAAAAQPHQQQQQPQQQKRHQQRRASNDAASRPSKTQQSASATSSSTNPAHAAAIAIATAAAAAHQQQAAMHAQQQQQHHQHHHSHQTQAAGGAGSDATSRSPSLGTGSFSPSQYVPTGTQAGGAGYGGGVAHHYGRAASLPGSAVGGSSNGRMRASTAANYGGGGAGSQSSAAAASAATLAALAVQNGQLAQQLAAMGGYTTRANGSSATPSLSALSAQHQQQQQQQQQQYVAQHYNSVFQLAYERHTAELTNCIIAFLSPILPTEEEYRIKEATRRQLERLAGKVSPGAKLLAFGSMANGFALRNSDMDLCCLIGKDSNGATPPFNASELVETLGQLIREETDFNVMPLPKARIPIIKISRPPTAELPYDISCDIGFENRLALENTRLLLSYAMVDPPRLRTLVLFLKVWTKRRKLNSPYTGTLSSYGYTLLVLFFLTHVKRPAVLPNLQRIPPARTLSQEEVELNGHNIYFYDDVATLRQEWASQNMENVGELLIDFFRYFSKEFAYSKDVISLRTEGGLIAKDNEAWSAELCIEDPFQLGYNVSRTVTKDGLYTIRGEFIRATRILTNQKGRVSSALAELCEEREDGLTRAPDAPMHHHQHRRPPHAAVDARLMRDMYHREGQRRYDAPGASAFNGSFAFEEMARGLGQGQSQRNAMARPTAAMLAPLSQNGGLSSPRQSRGSRTGTRYDGGRHSQPGATTVGSSARSEDGTGSSGYDATSKTSRASARTSPNYQRATPANGAVGEAQLLGNEISMQRMPSASAAGDAGLLSPQAAVGGSRGARSHSEGQPLNRSMSLPRGNMPPPLDFSGAGGKSGGPKQRIQLPLRSEPGSPSMAGQPPYGDFDAVTALSGMTLDVSGQSGPHSSSGCGSSRSASPLPPGSDNGTPYIAHSPWGFLQPSMVAGSSGSGGANMYRTGSASPSGHSFTLDALDDGASSISEGTLDELARISALEAANGSSDASPQMPPTLAPSARTRIHSWAQASTPRQPDFAAGAALPDAHLAPAPTAASSNGGNSPNEVQRAQFADGIVQAQATPSSLTGTAGTAAALDESQDMPTPTKRSHRGPASAR